MSNPLRTEAADPVTEGLDHWSLDRSIAAVIDSNRRAVEAVAAAEPALFRAAEGIVRGLEAGGRLLYAGAGTSGRIAVQDAAELPPTFGFLRAEVFLAGGASAGSRAREDAEDDAADAKATIDAAGLGANDVLLGLAASGTTPYTVAAITHARQAGAFTVGIANNPGTPLLDAAEVGVLLDTGPEILAGSTRLAAGTAQKIALNSLSTAVLVRLGGAYKNLMVGMRPTNVKLRARAASIVAQATGAAQAEAQTTLDQAGGSIRSAIVMIETGLDAEAAEALVTAHKNSVRDALLSVQER